MLSYGEVVAGSNNVEIAYKDQTGQTVEDVNGDPCGPYTFAPFGLRRTGARPDRTRAVSVATTRAVSVARPPPRSEPPIRT